MVFRPARRGAARRGNRPDYAFSAVIPRRRGFPRARGWGGGFTALHGLVARHFQQALRPWHPETEHGPRTRDQAISMLTKLGVRLTHCCPPELVADCAATLVPGLRVTRHLEDALRGTDVIMLLRVQKERLAGQKLRLQDYIARYQMTTARLKLAKRDAIVMHPGPIIRGLELTAEVADGSQSVIVDEVHNGVPTRMAILARALGKAK